MFEFMNYGESALTFAFFLIALYLNKDAKKKSYFLSVITGLMFVYTLVGMPFIQKNKASEHVTAYKEGSSLTCVSGFLMFGGTFTVDQENWDLEGNYFINKQTKQDIRTDKCTK